ncbi:hypothetical protein [Treponema sp.]|uniref:hypothetical protein n=1 Tax=Treponema sp. TaxID=166 RepID=UPI003890B36A
MNLEDIYFQMTYDNSVHINSPEQLDNLRELLESNFYENGFFFNDDDMLESAVKNTIEEEAIGTIGDNETIRKALFLGYYPMSSRKRATKLKELMELGFSDEELPDLAGKEIYMPLLTIKYHLNKLIVFFGNFHISKKLKGWLKGKFADYTITFNKTYDLCVDELLKAYPETWLSADLLKQYKQIHEAPDNKVSIDSVEIWHDGKLVAGEIGFITGNAYASLSGFHNENDAGTLQMCLLGLFLKNNGYAYWDLGMELDYKYRYGAVSCTRDEQEKYYATLSRKKLSFPEDEIRAADFLRYIE